MSVVDQHRDTDQLRLSRAGCRIHFPVRRGDAEEVAAIGQRVSVEDVRVLAQIGLQQLPFALVFAAEAELVDQPVAIRIVGLPGDVDLLRRRAGKRLRGRSAGRRRSGVAGVGNGNGVRRGSRRLCG